MHFKMIFITPFNLINCMCDDCWIEMMMGIKSKPDGLSLLATLVFQQI